MNAQELRIGNYLYSKSINQHFAINIDGIRQIYLTQKYKWIEPISLTEEWLLKFGFHINALDGKILSYSINDGYFILDYNFKLYYPLYYNLTIKYVHQLQNLYFALTGEELTITQ